MSVSEDICLIGWGAIGARVAALLAERRSPVRIVAVAVRDASRSRRDLPKEAALISHPAELAGVKAKLAVEVAGRDSVLPWGRVVLEAGMDFAISSTSAFVDDRVLAELTKLAQTRDAKLLVPPGALGGIDALAAAARLGLASVEHRIIKPARAWAGTIAENRCDLEALTEPTVFYADTARAAADAFPQNANVAVITSLAGIGLDRTRVSLVADPTALFNTHEIHAEGDFGRMEIRLENRPLATNPKSSEMTALNLVRLIENRVLPLLI
ncbi:aspartate dehydrogenase [Aminobacter sp. P9b]|uniref:aspartate dehydrogenase n=1 Tax=Aminobacter sp. P9b TaxID=3133697 RepID=UPI0032474C2E